MAKSFHPLLALNASGTARELTKCGGAAASLSLIFCCIMDQHVNVLVRMPKPKKRLTPELADTLVDVFPSWLGVGKTEPSLPAAFGCRSIDTQIRGSA